MVHICARATQWPEASALQRMRSILEASICAWIKADRGYTLCSVPQRAEATTVMPSPFSLKIKLA